MRAPSIGTALRLGRITALVVACLLFLHACDRTRRLLPTDVWLELVAAALLATGAMIAAWFEIVRAERIEEAEELEANHPPAPRADDLLYDTSTHAIRARIARSGNLVIHGREYGGPRPGHEWSWTFRTDTFPAVRTALGGGGDDDSDGSDVLELLEEVVPRLDADSRADPGAWLRAHGIAGTYREKGDHPSRTTHKLPILRPGPRRATDARTRASREESAAGPSVSEPTRRGSRRPASPTDAASARGARPAASEFRDARSGPNRRVDADRASSSRRRSDVQGPDSAPIRTGNRTPKPRPGSHSGPLPTARPPDSGPLPSSARHPYAFQDSAEQHSGPIARAAKRRAAGSRDIADHAARPDPPRRSRPRATADDLPETTIHGSRRASAAESPTPGLFSARTGIDPADTPRTQTSRSRARPTRSGPSPAADVPPTRLPPSPGDAASSGYTTSRGYDRPYGAESRYDRPAHHDPGSSGRDHDGPDHSSTEYNGRAYEQADPMPGQPRRRGHRYR
ncbi:hypothetical protein [Nocardia shimofusensis]|uniref:hypothetical protein n=1 Tax=Nocardia shimofusensis TaxID=228596 RepID=UPI00083391FC|nr:hypothetical protein [Nocardia shimofusensis]